MPHDSSYAPPRGPDWGNARKLPSGRWQARYQIKGVWRTAPETFRRKGLADSWLAATRTRPRSREAHGWTQVETSEQLAPFLGHKLNQAGVSAIEKTYDSERRRNIDVAEVVAFSRCFGFPIGWFFLPPSGHTDDLIEPVQTGELERVNLDAAHPLALVLGTPCGWGPRRRARGRAAP